MIAILGHCGYAFMLTSVELTNGSYLRSLWYVLMFSIVELTNGRHDP